MKEKRVIVGDSQVSGAVYDTGDLKERQLLRGPGINRFSLECVEFEACVRSPRSDLT